MLAPTGLLMWVPNVHLRIRGLRTMNNSCSMYLTLLRRYSAEIREHPKDTEETRSPSSPKCV